MNYTLMSELDQLGAKWRDRSDLHNPSEDEDDQRLRELTRLIARFGNHECPQACINYIFGQPLPSDA